MESYYSNFLRFDIRGSPPFYNGLQWPSNPYTQPLALSYPIDSNLQLNSISMFNTPYPTYDHLSSRYSANFDENTNSITSAYTYRSKDEMHSLFGDPSILLNQLIDELEDNSSHTLPSNTRSTIYSPLQEQESIINPQEKTIHPTTSTVNQIEFDSSLNTLQNKQNDLISNSRYTHERLDFQAPRLYSTLNNFSEPQLDSSHFPDYNNQPQIIFPVTSIERPRRINKNRGNHISALGLSSTESTQKKGFSNQENEEESDEYEANLERLLKQMDRREFQESWSKDWTLGLIRFCKYMQLSEKMQIGPAIRLKFDDNKCVILVLKKVFQSKPPAGWPSHGVRLQIQCGGFIQDILAWSSINRETWKTIMPLIAKGITQLIKKVGGVYKLKNGHQPYFNACRNALREDNSLFLLLKEYSRGVNTKKRRQNMSESEIKDANID